MARRFDLHWNYGKFCSRVECLADYGPGSLIARLKHGFIRKELDEKDCCYDFGDLIYYRGGCAGRPFIRPDGSSAANARALMPRYSATVESASLETGQQPIGGGGDLQIVQRAGIKRCSPPQEFHREGSPFLFPQRLEIVQKLGSWQAWRSGRKIAMWTSRYTPKSKRRFWSAFKTGNTRARVSW